MRIYIDPKLGDVRDLISFSETLVSVQEFYPDAVDYRPGAKLPVDFRRLDESEIDKYTASLDELSIENELDFVAIFPCNLKSENALDFTPFLSLSPVLALDASIDHGNCPSITVDRESGLRLGLHLDSWDGLDVSSRWKSRNRIVVNRGPGDRYVYVVPVPQSKRWRGAWRLWNASILARLQTRISRALGAFPVYACTSRQTSRMSAVRSVLFTMLA